MSRTAIPEIMTEGVQAHPAVQAWLQVQSDSWEPSSLELLQGRRYSTVYRLNHVRQDGARVIAKRCRTEIGRAHVSSHGYISYAVFCLKKKKKQIDMRRQRCTTHRMSGVESSERGWCVACVWSIAGRASVESSSICSCHCVIAASQFVILL